MLAADTVVNSDGLGRARLNHFNGSADEADDYALSDQPSLGREAAAPFSPRWQAVERYMALLQHLVAGHWCYRRRRAGRVMDRELLLDSQ